MSVQKTYETDQCENLLSHALVVAGTVTSQPLMLYFFQGDPFLSLLGMSHGFKFDDEDNYRQASCSHFIVILIIPLFCTDDFSVSRFGCIHYNT